jgi:hypothetical protein
MSDYKELENSSKWESENSRLKYVLGNNHKKVRIKNREELLLTPGVSYTADNRIIGPGNIIFFNTMAEFAGMEFRIGDLPRGYPWKSWMYEEVRGCIKEERLVAEEDPNGINQHDPGAKLDKGKNRVALVLSGFSNAIEEVSKVGTYGAEKYSPNGWEKVDNGLERYDNAMLRHWLAEKRGEESDPDTELLHAAHAAWNSLAYLELKLREKI